MKVELVGVSQGVAFERGPQTSNFLDFRTDSGKTFRIPVGEEAFNEVLANVYGEVPRNQQVVEEPVGDTPAQDLSVPPPDVDPDVTTFGGDGQVEQELIQEEREAADSFVREMPESEEDVPSL